MSKERSHLTLIKEPEMLSDFLQHLKNMKRKTNMLLYLGASFCVYCGLPLEELLSLTTHEVAGKSYLNPNTGRILLYSEDFSITLNDYIASLPHDCPYLFNTSLYAPYKPISVPYFSKSMSSAFEVFEYKGEQFTGNYTTLMRTFMYHFIINYGSCDSSLIRGKNFYTPRLLSMISMSQDEYISLVNESNKRDFFKVLPAHTEMLLNELDIYTTNYPNCEPLKNRIANYYKALYELSECMALFPN